MLPFFIVDDKVVTSRCHAITRHVRYFVYNRGTLDSI
jgi:hypothetical protein